MTGNNFPRIYILGTDWEASKPVLSWKAGELQKGHLVRGHHKQQMAPFVFVFFGFKEKKVEAREKIKEFCKLRGE